MYIRGLIPRNFVELAEAIPIGSALVVKCICFLTLYLQIFEASIIDKCRSTSTRDERVSVEHQNEIWLLVHFDGNSFSDSNCVPH